MSTSPMEAVDTELKPCPKCGSFDLFLRNIGGWEIDCRGCELSLVLADDPTRAGLVAAWNMRDSRASATPTDDWVAWLRYDFTNEETTGMTINVCSYDAPGAFKVYRATPQPADTPADGTFDHRYCLVCKTLSTIPYHCGNCGGGLVATPLDVEAEARQLAEQIVRTPFPPSVPREVDPDKYMENWRVQVIDRIAAALSTTKAGVWDDAIAIVNGRYGNKPNSWIANQIVAALEAAKNQG